MKKYIAILIAAILVAGSLTACGAENTQNVGDKDKLQIVTTIFPEYDWVRNILGDNPAEAEVTMLLDSGVDLHSYQPTVEDILKVSNCDLFIYVGGESDAWVEDTLREATNLACSSFCAIEYLTICFIVCRLLFLTMKRQGSLYFLRIS
ncbi:MAG: zinc ABC transporter substrate-binding protein [Lachnospiraceae bacterium]|nr:zinc ABC transporter substrate-binding protein [Lachnospiraceae bacterium]